MRSPLDRELLEQMKSLLRRDLKLGDDFTIADDMPFFGGDVDMDSLDMLLLVTSIEKQFGIHIENEQFGREVFQNLATLTRFVQDNRSKGNSTAPMPAKEGVDWLAQLPHGEPFRFITRVIDVKPGQNASAAWVLTGDETFFAGHFPGHPIVPGMLIAEALAQVAGLAGPSDSGAAGKLAQVDLRFEKPVPPPAEIRLHATFTRSLGALQIFDVQAKVGEDIVSRGKITLHRGDLGAS